MAKIEINQAVTKKISQQILQASTHKQVETIQRNIKSFIEETKRFNQQYKLMIKEIELYQNELQSLIKDWHEIKTELQQKNKSYKNTLAYIRYVKKRRTLKKKYLGDKKIAHITEVYKMAMSFQSKINAILGQSITTAYVWVGKKGMPQTYVRSDMQNFLKVDVDSSGKVVMRYRNNAKMLQDHCKKLEESIQNSDSFNYEKLLNTYSGNHKVKYRYDTYKVKGGGSYILWLNPSSGQKWHGAYVSSFGSINEAYASLLLHEEFNPTQAQQDDMELFMNVVLGVTNLSGTLKGDVSVNNMQIAVKSAGATTLDIQQLYQISEKIINQKLNNYEQLKNYLNDQKRDNEGKQHSINTNLNEALEEIVEVETEKIVNYLKNNK